jgi:hypothetical protein
VGKWRVSRAEVEDAMIVVDTGMASVTTKRKNLSGREDDL